jgi:hypothetical protein
LAFGPDTRGYPGIAPTFAATLSHTETLSMGFKTLGILDTPAIRTTGLLTFALAGLFPAEHTSLYRSQQRGVRIFRTTLFGSWFTATRAPAVPDTGDAIWVAATVSVV